MMYYGIMIHCEEQVYEVEVRRLWRRVQQLLYCHESSSLACLQNGGSCGLFWLGLKVSCDCWFPIALCIYNMELLTQESPCLPGNEATVSQKNVCIFFPLNHCCLPIQRRLEFPQLTLLQEGFVKNFVGKVLFWKLLLARCSTT